MTGNLIKIRNHFTSVNYLQPGKLSSLCDTRLYSNDGHYFEVNKYVFAAVSMLGRKLLPFLEDDVCAITTDLSVNQLKVVAQFLVSGTVPLWNTQSIADVFQHLEIEVPLTSLLQDHLCSEETISIPQMCRSKNDTTLETVQLFQVNKVETEIFSEAKQEENTFKYSSILEATLLRTKGNDVEAKLVKDTRNSDEDSWDEDLESAEEWAVPDEEWTVPDEEWEMQEEKEDVKSETKEVSKKKVIPLITRSDAIICKKFGVQQRVRVMLKRLQHHNSSSPLKTTQLKSSKVILIPKLFAKEKLVKLTEDEIDDWDRGRSDFEDQPSLQETAKVELEVYTCPNCGKEFNGMEPLVKHLKTEHQEAPHLLCSSARCEFKSSSLVNLSCHLKMVHKLKPASELSCPFCAVEEIWDEKELIQHLETVHEKKSPFQCPNCENKPFHFIWNLDHHQRQFHTPAICEICGSVHTNKEEHKTHMLDKHADAITDYDDLEKEEKQGEEEHMCKICGGHFETWSTLKKHLRKTYCGKKKPIAGKTLDCPFCDHCKKVSIISLSRHVKTVHGKTQPYDCHKCEKSYTKLEPLVTHVFTRHVPMTCDVCGYQGSNLYYLRRHQIIHRAKTFVCDRDNCDYATYSISALTLHISDVHGMGNNAFICDTCGKGFVSLRKLECHNLTHQVRFECKQKHCTFVTGSRAALRDHVKQKEHTFKPSAQPPPVQQKLVGGGTKVTRRREKITCKYEGCNHRCWSSNMNKHKHRAHGDEFRAQCTMCKFMCNSKEECLSHYKNVHNVENVLTCEFCHVEMDNLHEKKKHIFQEHPTANVYVECLNVNCQFNAPSLLLLIEHLKGDSDCGRQEYVSCPYKDNRCQFKNFKSVDNLVLHLQSEHPQYCVYKCCDCDFEDFDHNVIVQHSLEKHSIAKPFSCMLCKNKFAGPADLLTHHQSYHTRKGFYCCQDNCGQFFVSKEGIQGHMQFRHLTATTGDKEVAAAYQCETCSMSFSSENESALHMSSQCCVTKPFVPGKFKHRFRLLPRCNDCNVRFPHSYDYERHLFEIHGKTDTVKCQRGCHANFQSKKALDKHNKQVPNCGAAAASENSGDDANKEEKEKDEKDEAALKRFSCDFCNKAYATKALLGYHKRAKHQDHAMFTCPACGISMFDFKAMSIHMAVTKCSAYMKKGESGNNATTGVTTCSVCPKAFTHEILARIHERLEHPGLHGQDDH